jgi:hypothetical protein
MVTSSPPRIATHRSAFTVFLKDIADWVQGSSVGHLHYLTVVLTGSRAKGYVDYFEGGLYWLGGAMVGGDLANYTNAERYPSGRLPSASYPFDYDEANGANVSLNLETAEMMIGNQSVILDYAVGLMFNKLAGGLIVPTTTMYVMSITKSVDIRPR